MRRTYFLLAAGAGAMSLGAFGGPAFAQTSVACSTSAAAPSKRLAVTSCTALTQAPASSEAPPGTANGAADAGAIVITAEKRSERLQTVPIAITAISGSALERQGTVNVEDLQRLAPSLQVGTKQFGFQRIYIRGVGASSFGDPTVSIIQDGVPIWGAYFDFDVFDTKQVEVLRGPQGTVSGRNATAGAINVVSNLPTRDFQAGLTFTFGNYEHAAAEGYLSGPIVGDELLGRVAVRITRASGYVRNDLNGQELGGIDKVDARGSLVANLSEAVRATLIWEHNVDRSNPLYVVNVGRARPGALTFSEAYGVPQFNWDKKGPFESDITAENDSRKDLAALKIDADLGSHAHFVATTGYSRRNIKYMADFDGTPIASVQFNPQTEWNPRIWQISQEGTLTANIGSRLDLIAGALYLHGVFPDTRSNIGLPFFGLPNYLLHFDDTSRIDSLAGYTQWRYKITDKLRFTAGVRFTHDKASYDFGTYVGSPPPPPRAHREIAFNEWTPRFVLDYIPNRNLTVYASISKGYKAGGYNNATDIFKPEIVWNYEAGVKANLFDRRLSARIAVFNMDYSQLQQTIQNVDPVRGVTSYIVSADAKIRGAEFEFDATPTDRLHFNVSGSWLPTASYQNLSGIDPTYPELGVQDFSGNRLIHAPKYQISIGGDYTQPLGNNLQAVFRAFYSRQGHIFFNFYNNPGIDQPAYGLVNFSASLETKDDAWDVTAFVNNFTDQFYKTDQIIAPTGVLSPPAHYTPAWIGLPRMFGVSISHRF